MKLLLTSEGFTNQSIIDKLFTLVGKPPDQTSLVFIPTAAKPDQDADQWLPKHIDAIEALGFKTVETADLDSSDDWRSKVSKIDVIFVGGGSTQYLMHHMHQSGFASAAKELLKDKVYVGLSAGSMVAGTNPRICELDVELYDETEQALPCQQLLELTDLMIIPHFNSDIFIKVRKEEITEATRNCSEPVYALDDESAVAVDGDNIELITEGTIEIIKPASA